MMLSASCFCPNELALCLRYHHDHEVPDPAGWSACDPRKTLSESERAYQLPVVAMALAGARMLRGVISATGGQRVLQDCSRCCLPGYSHVMPNQPTAKKLLKTKRKTAATIPVVVLVCEVAPARIAIEIWSSISVARARQERCDEVESYSLASRAK
jgi:hypothetical protein